MEDNQRISQRILQHNIQSSGTKTKVLLLLQICKETTNPEQILEYTTSGCFAIYGERRKIAEPVCFNKNNYYEAERNETYL